MRITRSTPFVAALLLSLAPSLRAQTVTDPSGHWEGQIEAPGFETKFEIDLARNADGGFSGAFTSPAENLKGLPAKVTVTGKLIHFAVREDQPLNGYLSDDGKSISGDSIVEGFSIPFSMARTGEPRIEARAGSPAIPSELEGTWNGTLAIDGIQLRLVLTLANRADGMSIASIVNVDQGNLEIPVSTITRSAFNLTLDLGAISGSYTGTMNAEATELVGKYQQHGRAVGLTFRHAAAADRK